MTPARQATLGNATVLFHRKAQLLADDLRRRFGARDYRLNFTDAALLVAGADADSVLALRRHRILTVAPGLTGRYRRRRRRRVTAVAPSCSLIGFAWQD